MKYLFLVLSILNLLFAIEALIRMDFLVVRSYLGVSIGFWALLNIYEIEEKIKRIK